jgi:hypothetical protein
MIGCKIWKLGDCDDHFTRNEIDFAYNIPSINKMFLVLFLLVCFYAHYGTGYFRMCDRGVET